MELDIYCPDYKFAIEVDGLYWHSFETSYEGLKYDAIGGKQNYHLMKLEAAEKLGIQLIHLFEDDLRDNFNLCMELILSKLRLRGYKDTRKRFFARKCFILTVSNEVASIFYGKYHIQGFGQGIHYGLYYNDVLLSLMSFRRAHSNTSEEGSFELNRYATRFDSFVIGGFDNQFLVLYLQFP